MLILQLFYMISRFW